MQFDPPARTVETKETVEIVVQFVLDGTELKVLLPKCAKFKHVKKAIGKLLNQDADPMIMDKLSLLHKDSGVYEACKDHRRVGGIKNIFACGIELSIGDGTTATISDGDISEGEQEETEKKEAPQTLKKAENHEEIDKVTTHQKLKKTTSKPVKVRSAEDVLREKAREQLRRSEIKQDALVVVKQDFKSDTGGGQAVELRKGQRGKVKEVDGDNPGFALIAFDAHETLQWVCQLKFDKLCIADEIKENAFVLVTHDFRSNSEKAVQLSHGQRGRITSVDQDGDITIAFDALDQEQWVFKKNFEYLRVIGGVEDEPLSLKDALELQKELHRGFAASKFQHSLKALQNQLDIGEYTQAQFVKERQQLFLTVQSKTLPKYGFEGTGKGVIKMFTAMGPFLKDPKFAKLGQEINILLGLESPPDTWKKLANDSEAVVEAAKPSEPDPLSLVVVGETPGAMTVRASASSTQLGQEQGQLETGTAARHENNGVVNAAQPVVPDLKPWPPNDPPPYKMFVVGSWGELKPIAMTWENGTFVHHVKIGSSGCETFQLRKGRSASLTIYPSVAGASIFDKGSWVVRGPDDKHQSKSWKIGDHLDNKVKPGDEFVINVNIDMRGSVANVHCVFK